MFVFQIKYEKISLFQLVAKAAFLISLVFFGLSFCNETEMYVYICVYIYMISIDVGFARIGKYMSDMQLFVNLESGDAKKI